MTKVACLRVLLSLDGGGNSMDWLLDFVGSEVGIDINLSYLSEFRSFFLGNPLYTYRQPELSTHEECFSFVGYGQLDGG